ncbi:TIGR04219 family outer membrane beta-barrel protein [Celerinatantimonas sp. YJH-8]|uniref:TIGR04219 family outer membrane beta-barrel protein n=1 Tax=Celerinatantimonas sp. YJH-8 TaxID=3228714 RepID=UPI0038C1AD2F
MKKFAAIAVLATSSVLASVSAHADTLGARAGIDFWNMNSNSASVKMSGTTYHPDYDTKFRPGFYASVEHPIPLLPNFMVRYQDLDTSGHTGSVGVDSDLNMYDAVFYYQLFDNPAFGFDYGVNIKYFDGTAHVSGVSKDYSQAIPTLYLAANVNIPMTGLEIFGNTSNMHFDGNHVSDSQIGISYDVLPMVVASLQLRAGYRYLDTKFDDSGVKVDNTTQGWFLGLGMHL